MIIDAHLHVWSGDFGSFPFAEGVEEKEGAPVELLNAAMEEAGVDKAVIVQPVYYLYDNRYVAECLRRFPGKFAAIGLVDRHAPDAPDQLQRLVEEHGFGGLRIHLSRPDDPARMGRPRPGPDMAAGGGAGGLLHRLRPGAAAAGGRTDHRPLPRSQGRSRPHGPRSHRRGSALPAARESF